MFQCTKSSTVIPYSVKKHLTLVLSLHIIHIYHYAAQIILVDSDSLVQINLMENLYFSKFKSAIR